jgi:hypothetical protein
MRGACPIHGRLAAVLALDAEVGLMPQPESRRRALRSTDRTWSFDRTGW